MVSNLISVFYSNDEARIFMEDEDQVPLGGCSLCFTIRADVEMRNKEFHPDTLMILWNILVLHKRLERPSWFLVT